MSVGALFRRGGRFRGCESTGGVSELGFFSSRTTGVAYMAQLAIDYQTLFLVRTTGVVYMAYIAGY